MFTQDLPVKDLFDELVAQGRMLNRTKEAHDERIAEQIAEMQARAQRAAQASLERFQWRPKASIALINVIICQQCKSETYQFSGFGILMRRNSDAAVRIVMTPQLDPAFPRETHVTESRTASCMCCLPGHGFFTGFLHGN